MRNRVANTQLITKIVKWQQFVCLIHPINLHLENIDCTHLKIKKIVKSGQINAYCNDLVKRRNASDKTETRKLVLGSHHHSDMGAVCFFASSALPQALVSCLQKVNIPTNPMYMCQPRISHL